MIIAVDFDGAIVEHRYAEIGNERLFATDTLKALLREGHQLVLWTVREGKLLDDAIQWCRQRGIEFYAVNKDFPEEDVNKNMHYARKLRVDLFIDDRNVGGLPDWGTIYRMVNEGLTWKDYIKEKIREAAETPDTPHAAKKKWWQWF